MPTSKDDRHLPSKLMGAVVARYINLVHATCALKTEPADFAARLRETHPVILAVWHGQFMMIPKVNVDALPTKIVVAKHGDAQVIGEAFAKFNVGVIRGAGAGARKRDRGGVMALLAAIRGLRDGFSLCMTADVPPGPARQVGLGMITLAKKSGRPIVPAAMATRRYWSLSTWSRFTINLPFSKLGLVLGDPILVPKDATSDDMEALRQQLETALNDATRRAYELAGGNPARSTPPRVVLAQQMAAIAGSNDGLRTQDHSRTQEQQNAAGTPLTGLGWKLSTYRALTALARPLAPKILQRRENRGKEDGTRRAERLGHPLLPRPAGPLIWVHAASVGELNAILPLMEALATARPDLKFLVTTGTVTSAELAAKRLAHGPLKTSAMHQYIPLDAPQYVARFLDHWQPDLALFAESEIWPNMILEASVKGIALVLVNGRMSRKSYLKWRRNSAMATQLFGRFTLVLAQNVKLSRRFSDLGAAHTLALGNLKVDAPPPPVDCHALSNLRQMIGDRPVFVAASTHKGEDELIAKAHQLIKRQSPKALTIIVPRHPERAPEIAKALTAMGLTLARRTDAENITARTDIYLADTIGELGTFYQLSPIAFIGGSLVERGGQNPIEAIHHDACVLTGPHWQNFRDEYKALIKQQAVSEVATYQELAAMVLQLMGDKTGCTERRARGRNALEQMSGALARTLAALTPLLPTLLTLEPSANAKIANETSRMATRAVASDHPGSANKKDFTRAS